MPTYDNYNKHVPDRFEHLLIARLKEGRQDALIGIYHIYAQRLFSYCFSYTRSREESEEIVQDVFMQLWQSRADIKLTESLKAYIFVIAKNRVLNSFRGKVNEIVFEDYVDYINIFSTRDASCLIEYDEFKQKLTNELNSLPGTQRKVLVMRRIQGLSIQETASALRLSEQTVKNQLTLALKNLKERLGYTAM